MLVVHLARSAGARELEPPNITVKLL